jgi:hypothetical protein
MSPPTWPCCQCRMTNNGILRKGTSCLYCTHPTCWYCLNPESRNLPHQNKTLPLLLQSAPSRRVQQGRYRSRQTPRPQTRAGYRARAVQMPAKQTKMKAKQAKIPAKDHQQKEDRGIQECTGKLSEGVGWDDTKKNANVANSAPSRMSECKFRDAQGRLRRGQGMRLVGAVG